MSQEEHPHSQHASRVVRRPIPELQMVSLAPHTSLVARPENMQEAHVLRENRLYTHKNFKKTSTWHLSHDSIGLKPNQFGS